MTAPTAAEERATERLVFFSDAVVAIAITLLAIELPVPEGKGSSELLDSLGDHRTAYVTFAVSFAVIARHWLIHHKLFRFVERAPDSVTLLNFAWLFLVVVNPFLTEVLREEHMNSLGFGLYAGAQAIQIGILGTMISILAKDDAFRAAAPTHLARYGAFNVLASAAGFVVSIPLFPLVGPWAFLAWVVVPSTISWVLIRRGVLPRRQP